MKLVKWKVSEGADLLDCGSKHSESDRLVLDEILARKVGKFELRADRSYRIEAGELTTSAYGDEFEAVRGAACLDDMKLEPSGHLYASPKVAGLPRMNPDHVGADADREREDRALDEAIKALRSVAVRAPVDFGGGVKGAIRKPPCRPSGHQIVEERRSAEGMTRFYCIVCRRGFVISDTELRSIYPNTLEPIIRDRLTRIRLT